MTSNLPSFQSSNSSADLLEVTLALAAEMLLMAGVAKSVAEAKKILQKKLREGDALRKFAEMIADQYASYRKAKEGGPTA